MKTRKIIPNEVLKSAEKASIDITFLKPLFTDTNEINQVYFNQLNKLEKKELIEKCEQFRTKWLDELQKTPYPSDKYTVIYDLMMLLSYFFPREMDNGKIIDPVTSESIDQSNNDYVVLATGHWFFKQTLVEWYNSPNNHTKESNPLRAPYTAHDFIYIKSLPGVNLARPESKKISIMEFMLDPQITFMLTLLGGVVGMILFPPIGFVVSALAVLGGIVLGGLGIYSGINAYNYYKWKKDSAGAVAVTCDITPLIQDPQQSNELKQEPLTTTHLLRGQSMTPKHSVPDVSLVQSADVKSTGRNFFDKKNELSGSKAASFVNRFINTFRK